MELDLTAARSAADPLPVNTVFYQVLNPTTVLGPHGEVQYQMIGMTADMAAASQVAARHPGSCLTVTVVLFKTPQTLTPPSPHATK